MNNMPETMMDAKGRYVPVETVKAADKLIDEVVDNVINYAKGLNAQIARFKGHTYSDLGDLDALLEQEYNVVKGGKKGNRTYQSYNGCKKISVQVADNINFGPELQIAKNLIDECLNEWSADSRPELSAVVTRAFNTDKEGQINKSEIFMLMRMDIDDERWQNAMQALRDAMRVIGTKTYIRFYHRDTPDSEWNAITIDMAKA